MAVHRIIGCLALFEAMGLLGFIVVSRYQEGMVVRYLPLLFAFVAVVFVAYLKEKVFSYKEIAYISVAASAIFILLVQLLGFAVYPGLAKGITFLSGENMVRIAVMLSVGTVGHFLLLSFARVGWFSSL